MLNLNNRPDLLMYGKMLASSPGYIAGQVELTSLCNQRCVACQSWRDHQSGAMKDRLSYEEIVLLFRELEDMKSFEHLAFTGGEPLFHPDIARVAQLAGEARFPVQLNTCLPPGAWDPGVLRRFAALRVSLDSVNPSTYHKCRGVEVDPESILSFLDQLRHPHWFVNVCVSQANVGELPEIVQRLSKMSCKPRKINFLPVIGVHKDAIYWQVYQRSCHMLKTMQTKGGYVATSIDESSEEVRKETSEFQIHSTRCFSSLVGFHIKCNGDVYPCCLAGGEAVETQISLRLGSIRRSRLASIRPKVAPRYYECKACRDICQWKQLALNQIGQLAELTTLRMP